MPKHVTYPGPHAAVTVVGHSGVIPQGESVEVDSDLADRLYEQGWMRPQQVAAQERRGEPLTPPDAPPVDVDGDPAE